MLTYLFTNPLVAFLFMVGFIVFIHEFGHFIVGKMLGIGILEFSIGFGPQIISFKRGQTLYKLCILPLGGYVRFVGMEGETSPSLEEGSFINAPLYKRFLISLAGPFSNFILSFLVFVLLFSAGMPDTLPHIGILPLSPAGQQGLQEGDLVTQINQVPIHHWKDLSQAVSRSQGSPLKIDILRQNTPMTLEVTPSQDKESKRWQLGIVPEMPGTLMMNHKDIPFTSLERIIEVDQKPIHYRFELLHLLPQAQTITLQAPTLDQTPVKGETRTIPLTGDLKQSLTQLLPAELQIKEWDLKHPLTMTLQNCGLAKGQALNAFSWGDHPLVPILNQRSFIYIWQKPLGSFLNVKTIESKGVEQTHTCSLNLEAKETLNSVTASLPFIFEAQPELAPSFHRSLPLGEAFQEAGETLYKQTIAILDTLKKLFTQEVSAKALGGPLLIARIAGEAAQSGWMSFLFTLSIISLNIGIFNLLPIPPLDGGHILLYTAEALYRKKLPKFIEQGLLNIGVSFMLLLMAFVFYNDIRRFFHL